LPEAAGPSAASLAFAALSIVVLLASGWWTNRRYRRVDRLPGHYDFTGKATRMDSRKVMTWLLPVMFSLVIAAMAGLQLALPAQARNGDPSAPLYFIPMILLGAQGLVLWLLHRWAARQPRG
jgi:uncharacterized membrane protein